MLYPIGSDQARTRYPRITISIMAVCFAVYFVTFWLHGAYGVYAVPIQIELDNV